MLALLTAFSISLRLIKRIKLNFKILRCFLNGPSSETCFQSVVQQQEKEKETSPDDSYYLVHYLVHLINYVPYCVI